MYTHTILLSPHFSILHSLSSKVLAEVEVVVAAKVGEQLLLGDVALDLLRAGEEDEAALRV